MGDPLTESEQFTLRSDAGELIRVTRIAVPDSLYGASASEQTSESIEGSVVNPIYFGEIADVDLTSAKNAKNYPHMPGFE